jgi:hypothetical protein
MSRIRIWVEYWLRAMGAFQVTKRLIQRFETVGLRVLTSWKQMTHGGSWPPQRQGNLVMFHTARSGSSVTAGLLSQHPEIYWGGELFNYRLPLWRSKSRDRLMEARSFIKPRINHVDIPFYGFEVLPTQLRAGQIETDVFVTVLEDFGIENFVLLTRRNILRKIVSTLVARERKRWHLKSGEIAPLTQIYIDTANLELESIKPLLEHIRDVQAEYETLQALLSSRRYLHLVYEDDVLRDPRRGYRKICRFLGVQCVELPVRHERTTPQPLSQIIQNYADLEYALSGTEFEWMLEEGGVSRTHLA